MAFTGSQGGGQLSLGAPHLAGVALAAVLEGLSNGIALLNPDVYDQLRFWQAGSLDIRTLQTLKIVLLPVVIAGIAALLLSRALNSLSLGNDTATALRQPRRPHPADRPDRHHRPVRQRHRRRRPHRLYRPDDAAYGALAGGGPIIAGRFAGHPCSPPPALLLFADVIGRLLVPGELRVSVVSAFLGAPVLIWLVRRQPRGGGL